MNKLKLINSILVAFVLTTFVFVPINSYSVEYSNRMITTNDSPYDISMQYQIRDKHQNLICVVESSVNVRTVYVFASHISLSFFHFNFGESSRFTR